MMSESGVVYKSNSTGPNTELWNIKHDWRRTGSRIVDNNALISVQKVRSKPLESDRADAKDSFETGKKFYYCSFRMLRSFRQKLVFVLFLSLFFLSFLSHN